MKTGEKTVLITGASSGIGLELAKIFAKNGYSLVLCSRSRQKLTSLGKKLEKNHNINTTSIKIDLSKKGSAKELYDKVKERNIQVNILVNDAGVGLWGEFIDTDSKKEQAMIHLNITSLTELNKFFLRDMTKRNEGKILNVGSLAGFFPGPLESVYYATKAYVISFSESLSHELKDTNITLSCLCPGPTKTGIEKASGADKSKLYKGNIMQPEEVAQIAYNGLMKGKRIIVPGINNKLSYFSSLIIPPKITAYFVERKQERI